MLGRIPNTFRCAVYVAGIAVALLCSSVAAISAEETNSGSDVCAQREALPLTLVEAHGAAPNFASDKLAAESLALAQTRSACDNGHAKDAAALYDRLIDELTVSLNGAK
jgi:hypothetical protein